jgi:anti-anti-sigma factor
MIASLPTRPVAGYFDAAVASCGGVLSVTIAGAVDFFSAREARELLLDLLDQEPRAMLVDVRDVFVDSSGIGVLVHAAQRARQERRDFRLMCDDRLAVILRLHGLHGLLGIGEAASVAREPGHGRRLAA